MKKHTNKIISFVIVLAVIVLGLIYWHKAPKQAAVVQPVIEEGTTDGWKTYSNTEYGFEFLYPSESTVEDIPGVLFAFTSTKLPLNVDGLPKGSAATDYSQEGFQFALNLLNKGDINIDVSKSVDGMYISTKVDVPNVTAYRIQTIEPETPTVIFVEDAKLPGKYILINYLGSPDVDKAADRSVDKILATLKFTK